MPVPHGREKVPVNMDEIQEITDRLEDEQEFPTKTKFFEAVAAAYVAAHPEMSGKVTYTVVRLRFDKKRTPETTLKSKTLKTK